MKIHQSNKTKAYMVRDGGFDHTEIWGMGDEDTIIGVPQSITYSLNKSVTVTLHP